MTGSTDRAITGEIESDSVWMNDDQYNAKRKP